ncbi:hypothetical protein KDX31_04395 [Amphritea atlantica]|uniref:Uncharacterized protein n=1 Tax=Amphritea atlantica TaxID=355243 RepID=A0ABY5GYC0_9GAMM|nr:hypothetical protein KDX31_04395 [Amphritea atlantica]
MKIIVRLWPAGHCNKDAKNQRLSASPPRWRWLNPGGVFILCDRVRQPLADYLQHPYATIDLASQTPDYDDLIHAFQHFQEHNRYHPDDIIQLHRQCGFKISATEIFKNSQALRIAAISV